MVWEIDQTKKRVKDLRNSPPPPHPSPDDQWIAAPMPVSVYMALNIFGSDFFFLENKSNLLA